MKYAVIADIHGNLPALKAVLEDAAGQGITRFLFAGDYGISGPWPDECVALIRALPDRTVIRGNEEQYLENLVGQDPAGWTDGQMQISYWTFRNMRRDNLDWLLSLPHTAELEYGGVRIRMAHHTQESMGAWVGPDSVRVAGRYAGAMITHDRLQADVRADLEQDPASLERIAALEKGVYVFGHSHVQWTWRDEARGVYIINPGSCGLPLDAVPDSMPYTVLEITDGGRVRIEERRIPFDKAAYIRTIRQTAPYREAAVWSRVIERELAFAREHMYFFLGFVKQYAEGIGDERRPYAPDTWEKAYEIWSGQQEEVP